MEPERLIQIHSKQILQQFVPDSAMHPHFQAVVKHRYRLPLMQAMEHGKIGFYVERFKRPSVIGAVALLIFDYLNTLSIAKKPEQSEVMEWARIIADEYLHFSLAEVAVFLEGCKRGTWQIGDSQKLYGGISRIEFFQMWENFCEKRETLDKENRRKIDTGPIHPKVQKVIEEGIGIKPEISLQRQKTLEPEQNRREGIALYPKWMREEIEREERVNAEVAEEAAERQKERGIY